MLEQHRLLARDIPIELCYDWLEVTLHDIHSIESLNVENVESTSGANHD